MIPLDSVCKASLAVRSTRRAAASIARVLGCVSMLGEGASAAGARTQTSASGASSLVLETVAFGIARSREASNTVTEAAAPDKIGVDAEADMCGRS